MNRDLLVFARLFAARRVWLAGGMGLTALTVLASVGLLSLSGWFISASAVAGATPATAILFNFLQPGAGVRGFALTRTVSRYAERVVTHEATFRLLRDLRVWFFKSVVPIGPGALGGQRGGDLLARATGDIDALDALYLRVMTPTVVALAIGGLVVLLLAVFVDGGLALVLAGWMFVVGLAVPALTGWLGRRPGAAAARGIAALRLEAVDLAEGLADLTAYGATDRQLAALDRQTTAYNRAQQRSAMVSGFGAALYGLCVNLAILSVLVLGLLLLEAGQIAGPVLALLVLGSMAVFEASAGLPGAYQALGRIRTAAGRILQIARMPPVVAEPASPRPLPDGLDLRLEGVRFRYPGAQTPALDGIDLEVPAGARIGVAGPSGAGKSTLAGLLLRFWDPEAGRILIGGVPLAELRRSAVCRQIGLLSQHTELFDDTIRNNLLLARPDAAEGALAEAVRLAGLEAWLVDLPRGLDTWIGEGGLRVSGGQARRIALARVLLHDAPVLILDEPTSGLDPATEEAVFEALRSVMAGRTVVIITHRVNLLADADSVVFLEGGRVVERGRHGDLVAANGRYARLAAGDGTVG